MESFPWLASHKRLSGRICKTHWINLCSLFSKWITLDHPIYPMLHRQRNLYFQSGPTRAYFLVSHMGVHMRFAWRESAKEDNRQRARSRLKVMSFLKPDIAMPFDFRTIVTWFAHLAFESHPFESANWLFDLFGFDILREPQSPL